MKGLGIVTLVCSTVALIAVITYGTICSIQFERNCSGYLKHAADANTVGLARQELAKAVSYIEQQELTQGSTDILYATPACDLAFWYENLKAALVELESTPADIDRISATNQLMKLRETLMDQGEKGSKVTRPPNIAVFPNQIYHKPLILVTLLGMLIGGAAWGSECSK